MDTAASGGSLHRPPFARGALSNGIDTGGSHRNNLNVESAGRHCALVGFAVGTVVPGESRWTAPVAEDRTGNFNAFTERGVPVDPCVVSITFNTLRCCFRHMKHLLRIFPHKRWTLPTAPAVSASRP